MFYLYWIDPIQQLKILPSWEPILLSVRFCYKKNRMELGNGDFSLHSLFKKLHKDRQTVFTIYKPRNLVSTYISGEHVNRYGYKYKQINIIIL